MVPSVKCPAMSHHSPTVELLLKSKCFRSLNEVQQQLAGKVLLQAAEDASELPAEARKAVLPVARPSSRRNGASRLSRTLWFNLDRRPDRAHEQETALKKAGLSAIAERVAAVDGSSLDLHTISQDILSREGREQALAPTSFVLGRVLTPGAVGLWLTWHTVLTRIAKEAANEECYLVVEDDAVYCEGFGSKLKEVLAALDSFDASWHAAAVGYIRSKTRLKRLLGDGPVEDDEPTLDSVIGRIWKLTGAAAIVIRGAEGAQALLDVLFPVRSDSQFDFKLSTVVDYYGMRLRMYCSAIPLAQAPLSEAGDSDIQRIPEEKRAQLQLEASIRHELGDAADVSEAAVHDIITSGRFESLLKEPGLPPVDPGDLEKLLWSVHRSLEQIRKPDSGRVRWSLEEGFSLVGNWTDWKEPFTTMTRKGSAWIGEVQDVRPGTLQEFQILVAADWTRRFFPMEPFALDVPLLGPMNRHGFNFAKKAPEGVNTMVITWSPLGMRRLTVEFLSRAA